MNYRHHFHAGNFADVMKHAVLLALIEAMQTRGALRVVETHAGAGLYDLSAEAAQRANEAMGGVGRLISQKAPLPKPLLALKNEVEALNADGSLRFYPGSPWLAAHALNEHGRYLGYELRPDDFASLQRVMANTGSPAASSAPARANAPEVQVKMGDGYGALRAGLLTGDLVLIDPPYERPDDYERACEAVKLVLAHKAAAAIWTPIKDLETLDAFLRRLEALQPPSLVVAEVRLRRLVNPMKMNGCAMVLVNAPDIDPDVDAICGWVAQACGDTGGWGRATRHE